MRAQAEAGGTSRRLHAVLVGAMEGAIATAAGDDVALERALAFLREQLPARESTSLLDVHGGAVGHAAAAAFALRLGRPDEAEVHLREGYAQARLTHDKPIIAAVGMSVALWARDLGRHRDAAVLLGAAVRLRGAEDPTSPSVMELVGSLREALGDEYDIAYAEGCALDLDAAVVRVDPDALQALRR